MTYPRMRIVRAKKGGWAVYACPSEESSLYVGGSPFSKDAVAMAFAYLWANALLGWVVEFEGNLVDPPERLL